MHQWQQRFYLVCDQIAKEVNSWFKKKKKHGMSKLLILIALNLYCKPDKRQDFGESNAVLKQKPWGLGVHEDRELSLAWATLKS